MPRFNPIDVAGLDLKLGLRLMRKSWGLTLVGGVAMALTIGLGTAIFTLWNTATTTALPLPEGDRIVAIQSSDLATQQTNRDSSLADFRRWRELSRSLTDVSAMRRVERTLVTPGGASGPILVGEMTASAFRLTRVHPVLGRTFADDDERQGARVVVIGADLWQTGFASDPAVLGRQLQLDGEFYTVVGVMPGDFAFPISERIWTPLRTDPSAYAQNQPEVFVFARMAQGFTPESAQAEVASLGLSAQHDPGKRDAQVRVRVVPYVTGIFGFSATDRWLGSVVVVFAALLLIPPCVNIAILVYARTITRREEFAARYALGATRGRIVMQIFVEALVLAAAAGMVGSLLAREFAIRISRLVMPTLGPGNVPFWFDFSPSLGTILCLAGLVVVAAAIVGAIPGMRATGRQRPGLHTLGGSITKAGLGRTWTALLAIQVALSIAILPTATQLIWGLVRTTNPGMAVDQYLTAWLVTDGDTSSFGTRQSEFARRLQAESAVSGVTLSESPLMEESSADLKVEGGPEPSEGQAAVNRVDSAFFNLFGARFRAGRTFGPADFGPGRSDAIIVNRTFAVEIAGAENALGRRVRYVTPQDPTGSASPSYEIVGVVDDFPATNRRATVFHPLSPSAAHQVNVTVHVRPNGGPMAARLQEAAKLVDPALHIGRVRSLGEIYRKWQSMAYTLGFMLGSVMLMVLLFTMAGMYTLTAFIVAQRWREVGLRYALGAGPGQLISGLFGRSLVPIVIGAAVGCVLALLVDSSIKVEDVGGQVIPGIVPAVAIVMVAVGVVALAGPARRVLRINPVQALRMNA